MCKTRFRVEQGFQPAFKMGILKSGFQPLRYVVPGSPQRTSGAEARMFLACSCRPEALLHSGATQTKRPKKQRSNGCFPLLPGFVPSPRYFAKFLPTGLIPNPAQEQTPGVGGPATCRRCLETNNIIFDRAELLHACRIKGGRYRIGRILIIHSRY